jgi:hypothetical protein
MAARTITSVRLASREEARHHAGSEQALVLVFTSDLDAAVGAPIPMAFSEHSLHDLLQSIKQYAWEKRGDRDQGG